MATQEADSRVREGRELLLDARLVPSLAIATTAPAASNQVDIWTWSFADDQWHGPQPGFTLVPIRALMVGLVIDVAAEITRLARMVNAARRARREGFAASVGGRPKRLLDIAVALTALILLCPLMLVVAALIKLTTGGPVIFAHPRVGFEGKTFRCFKFRSMIVDADAMLARHLAANPIAAQEWCEHYKLKDDPRITSFGRLLRKSSLDELPQLFNVLRGEMSCVGPRPIVAAELARYGPRVGCYLRARPGMTGMWQVSGRSTCSYHKRVMLDRLYVRRWTIWLDLAVLLRTIPAVLAFDHAA